MSDTKEHDRIWLQTCGDSMSEWYGEITWCQDKIHDDDVGYVNANLYAQLEAENAALKANNWHMKCVKDYDLLAAQHRIKQLRDVIDSFSRTLAHNGSVPYRVCCGVADDLTHDKNCIAMKALALPDSTAELDAVMKDAERWREFQKNMDGVRENLFLTMKNTDLTGKGQP